MNDRCKFITTSTNMKKVLHASDNLVELVDIVQLLNCTSRLSLPSVPPSPSLPGIPSSPGNPLAPFSPLAPVGNNHGYLNLPNPRIHFFQTINIKSYCIIKNKNTKIKSLIHDCSERLQGARAIMN